MSIMRLPLVLQMAMSPGCSAGLCLLAIVFMRMFVVLVWFTMSLRTDITLCCILAEMGPWNVQISLCLILSGRNLIKPLLVALEVGNEKCWKRYEKTIARASSEEIDIILLAR